MRDFRFHVASLMAIFLALAVGMFIGHSIQLSSQTQPFKDQMEKVLQQNGEEQDENRSLREERTTLLEMRKHLDSEVSRLAELSVSNRLAGRTVSILVIGARPVGAMVEGIRRTLRLAGAQRVNETVIRGSLLPPSPQALQEMATRIQAAPDVPQEVSFAQAVARSIGSGADPLFPVALDHRNAAIDTSGNYSVHPDLVVLVMALDSEQKVEELDRNEGPIPSMVETLQGQGVRVVECETSLSNVSAVSYFRRNGISSVDDAETLEGQVALVWACLGDSVHYGVRQGADSLLPGGAS